MSVKHVYWFAYFGLAEPSVRYRAKYPLEILNAQHGITYDLILPSYRPAGMLRFARVFFSILLNRKSGSVIVFEKIRTKRIYAAALMVLLRAQPKRTIYDIDDADYIKFPPETIYHFIRRCKKCTVGSSALASVARQMNDNVCLLTSPVVDHHSVKGRRNERFVIGWIGYYNAHRESLMRLLFPALLGLEMQVDLVIMGITSAVHIQELQAYFAKCANVRIVLPEQIDWHDEAAIYKMISSFDIGVAPLLGTAVNEAKSAFKLKQYLSCGVPVLGSSVGENTTFLQHGINGYCCDEANDYLYYLNKIANMDDDGYATLSENALNITELFSMQQYCDRLLEYMND